MSLLEIVVLIMVGMAALAATWAFFHSGIKQTTSTDRRLKGVLGAHLLVQYLEHDLKRIYYDRAVSGRDPALFTVAPKLEPTGNSQLTFFIFDPEQTDLAAGKVIVKPVQYQFDYKSGKVTRSEPGRKIEFQGTYERVVFGWLPNDGKVENTPFPYTEYPPYKPVAAAKKPLPHGLVTYQITCVAEEVFRRDPSLRNPEDRTTVCGGVIIPSKVTAENDHFWLLNWTSWPRLK